MNLFEVGDWVLRHATNSDGTFAAAGSLEGVGGGLFAAAWWNRVLERLFSNLDQISYAVVLRLLLALVIGSGALIAYRALMPTSFAIFRRNFSSYFTNPTGYVFICLFVLLTAVAQFMPDAFFSDNLDNLDQLNSYLPVIMLFFIPAVTMGMWSEERREGTDELLLTMPVSDLDVVLGKYTAALAIFTVALGFSLSNVFVLAWLGTPDYGMIQANYLGYWLVGAAMLSIGMAASFVTRNLTVAFILGLVFNVPLVAMQFGDSIVQKRADAERLVDWSVGTRFNDFANGVVSASSVAYFVLIPAVLLYLAMVLIGRRHWSGALRTDDGRVAAYMYAPRALLVVGLAAAFAAIVWGTVDVVWKDGWAAVQPGPVMGLVGVLTLWAAAAAVARWFVFDSGEHYLVRTAAFAVVAVTFVVLADQHGVRSDWSDDQVTALTQRTKDILVGLGTKQGWAGQEVAADRFDGAESMLPLDGAYVGATLRFTDAPLDKQSRKVAGYIGKTRTFMLASPLPQAPKPGAHFVLERPPVVVDAFISPRSGTPKEYIQTHLNLVNALKEIKNLANGLVTVNLHETQPLSEAARTARDQYGITPRLVPTESRGKTRAEELFLGLAIVSGTQKGTIPFVDRGVPVEFEVVRAIATVAQQQKKRLGVVTTDVKLFGSFNMQTMQPTRDEAIITELQKQYELVKLDMEVKDANDPARDRQLFEDEIADLDALLAVQPSSLGPDQLERFLKAVRTGVPTAIFEDPYPVFDQSVPGSSPNFQRQAPGGGGMAGMMGMGGGGPPPPKADVHRMWTFLGVNASEKDVVAQAFNPYPRAEFPPEFVWVAKGSGSSQPFNGQDPITDKLEQLLFPFPGFVAPSQVRKNIKFEPLVRTGPATGTVDAIEMVERSPFGQMQLKDDRNTRRSGKEYVLAAKITGDLPPERMPMQGEAVPPAAAGASAATGTAAAAGTAAPPAAAVVKVARTPRQKNKLNAVVVCDIDLLYSAFVSLRDRGKDPTQPIHFDIDNVTFALNIVDELAGDDRFVEIRNRRRKQRTLVEMEQWENQAREDADAQREKQKARIDEALNELTTQAQKAVDDIQKRNIDDFEKMQKIQLLQESLDRRAKAESEKSKYALAQEMEKIKENREVRIREMQAFVKLLSISVAPILPLSLGLMVFAWRRSRETEGVSKNRLV